MMSQTQWSEQQFCDEWIESSARSLWLFMTFVAEMANCRQKAEQGMAEEKTMFVTREGGIRELVNHCCAVWCETPTLFVEGLAFDTIVAENEEFYKRVFLEQAPCLYLGSRAQTPRSLIFSSVFLPFLSPSMWSQFLLNLKWPQLKFHCIDKGEIFDGVFRFCLWRNTDVWIHPHGWEWLQLVVLEDNDERLFCLHMFPRASSHERSHQRGVTWPIRTKQQAMNFPTNTIEVIPCETCPISNLNFVCGFERGQLWTHHLPLNSKSPILESWFLPLHRHNALSLAYSDFGWKELCLGSPKFGRPNNACRLTVPSESWSRKGLRGCVSVVPTLFFSSWWTAVM